jgi:NAD(P)-dependent dehydrogenase (short-subunit alcohol dehydrogenase family)
MGADNRRLEGKVALITGAGQGIGEGIAYAFAKAGARLVLTGRTAAKVEAVAENIRAFGGEVRCMEAVSGERAAAARATEEAIAAFGRLDVLLNNAHSFTPFTLVEDLTEAAMRLHFESGVIGSLQFMQAAFPHMRAQGGGSIINTSSSYSIQCPPGHTDYAAAKEAIRALTRTAAKEWGKYRIRVNNLQPSALSPYAAEYLEKTGTYEAEVARQPIGYIGTAEDDVAPIALFLASDDSHYLTGQTIGADGGRVML